MHLSFIILYFHLISSAMFYIRRPSSFYGYPVQDTTPSPSSYEEQYYREVAAEHRRRADAALALAQQEHARTALRQRQAQAQAQAIRIRAERERQHELYLARARAEQQRHFSARPTSFHHPGFPIFQSQDPTFAPRRVYHPQQPQGPTDGPFIDFLLEILNAFQPEEPTVSKPQEPKKEVRFNDIKGKGKAREEDLAPQAQRTRKEEQQPEEEEDFISNLLHALRSGESDDLLRQMGLLSPSSSGAGPSSSAAAPGQTPKKAAPTPVSVPVPVRGPSASHRSTPSSPHAQSFTSIDGIQHRFDALKASFQFPTTLDFESSTSTSAKLPYNSTNAPVHTYESELIKLLTKLDAVDSDGAESVRGARRALVLAVERELDAIDAGKERVWKAQQLEKQKEEVDVAADPVEQPTAGAIIVDDYAVIADERTPTAEEPVTGYFVGPTPTQDTTFYATEPVAENVAAASTTSNSSTAVTATGDNEQVAANAAVPDVSPVVDNAAEEVETTASPDHIDSVLTDAESDSGDEEPTTIPGVAGHEEFDVVSDASSDEMVEVRDSDSEQTVTAPTSSLKAKVAEDSDEFEML